MRRAAVAAVTTMLMLGATGCGTACTTLGFINTIAVDTSAFDSVTEVQFCVDSECSPREDEPLPTGSPSLFSVDQDGDAWTLNLDMRAPERVTIRLFGADGTMLQESEHTIHWTPPTGQCGGASTAPPIIVRP